MTTITTTLDTVVHDDYIDGYIDGCVDCSKKMYNRGPIMSIEERDTLNNWVNDLFKKNILESVQNGKFVKSVRETYDENIIPLFFEIKKRIEEKEKLSSFKHETIFHDVISFIPKDGFIHKHTDPNEFQNNLLHTRFNVFITVPPNDTTYYNGHVVDAVECCYVLCRSGIDVHWTDVNTSDIPRITLSFGYVLPAEKIDELTSDQTIGIYTQYYPLVTCYNKVKYIPLILNNNLNSFLSSVEECGQKGNCIYTISNLMTEKQCDCLVDYIKNNSSIYNRNAVGNYNSVECDFIYVTKTIPEFETIDSFLFEYTKKILAKFHDIQPSFKGKKDTGFTLRKIFGGIKLHDDGVTGGFIDSLRSLSIIVVLNDDYDGGIFNFPNQELKLRVKKGEAILFPPYWTHPYSVSSVGEGQAQYTFNTCIFENFIN